MKFEFISPDVILDSISKKASSSELAFPDTYKPAPALRIQISLRESWIVLLKNTFCYELRFFGGVDNKRANR